MKMDYLIMFDGILNDWCTGHRKAAVHLQNAKRGRYDFVNFCVSVTEGDGSSVFLIVKAWAGARSRRRKYQIVHEIKVANSHHVEGCRAAAGWFRQIVNEN